MGQHAHIQGVPQMGVPLIHWHGTQQVKIFNGCLRSTLMAAGQTVQHQSSQGDSLSISMQASSSAAKSRYPDLGHILVCTVSRPDAQLTTPNIVSKRDIQYLLQPSKGYANKTLRMVSRDLQHTCCDLPVTAYASALARLAASWAALSM